LESSTHIILPGVGSAKATMNSLHELGLIKALEDVVLRKNVYFLGVCVGMQVLFEHSEEEDTNCLGWFKGRVVKYNVSEVRVPQMGWNLVRFTKETPIDTKDGYFYFVNSYYAVLSSESAPLSESGVWAVADYNEPFTAAVQNDNIYATQFHVEKSGKAGLLLLGSFLSLNQHRGMSGLC
jgi:glutamine amidotransferase